MGKHGLSSNKITEGSLLSFMLSITLSLAELFPHKKVHVSTWVLPDHVTQIDRICISQCFRRSLLDVRVKRGADAASDHHLLIGKLKLKLKRFPTDAKRTDIRYNVTLLQDLATVEQFRISLSNRFQALQD